MIPRRAIKQYAAEVARRFKPERIILFGSYAYGTPTPDSDVDLLVVMPCKGSLLQAAVDVRLAISAGFPLDLLVRTSAEVRKRLRWKDCFMQEITSKGKVLYAADHAGVGQEACERQPAIVGGINCQDGKLTSKVVADAHGVKWETVKM